MLSSPLPKNDMLRESVTYADVEPTWQQKSSTCWAPTPSSLNNTFRKGRLVWNILCMQGWFSKYIQHYLLEN